MIRRAYRYLLNRKNVGPEILPSETCQIPGCEQPAVDQWFPSFCALREAGIEVDWVAVCAGHDFEANASSVRFFFGDQYDEALEEYGARRLPEPPSTQEAV